MFGLETLVSETDKVAQCLPMLSTPGLQLTSPGPSPVFLSANIISTKQQNVDTRADLRIKGSIPNILQRKRLLLLPHNIALSPSNVSKLHPHINVTQCVQVHKNFELWVILCQTYVEVKVHRLCLLICYMPVQHQ